MDMEPEDSAPGGGGEPGMSPDARPWLADPDPTEALIQALFLEGAPADAEARRALCDRIADPARRARLRALFAAHDALPPETPPLPVPPLDPARLIGLTFGDFTVRSFLASGGTADVYIARQGSPARDVVLKVRRARHGSEGQVRRFLAEAERLANFSHPGIAHIYGSGTGGEAGRSAWIAMERIDGVALAEWRERPEATPDARIRLVAEIAGTVAAAHAHGIVHRDLAPANIRVDRNGLPRLIDFGISRTLHAFDEHPTIEGTPGFASPEQARGERADPRDDVYALGRLLEWLVPDAPMAVARLAETATRDSRESRPSASEFARRLGSPARGGGSPRAWLALALVGVAAVGASLIARGPGLRAGGPERSEVSAAAVERVMTAVLDGVRTASGGAAPAGLVDDIARAEDTILAETEAPARVRWRALEKLGLVWRDLGHNARAIAAGARAAEIAEDDPEAPALVAERLRAWCAVRLANGEDRAAALAAVHASLAELARSATAAEDGSLGPPAGPRRDAHQNYAQAHVYLALAAKLCGELALSREATGIAGPFHRTGVFAGTRSQVTYLVNAARLELALGDCLRARALADEAVAASGVVERDDALAMLATRALRAGVVEQCGAPSEATATYREAVEIWSREAGPNDPRTITALNNLGLNLLRCGDAGAALPVLEDACTRALRVHGERHQHTLDDHANLALALERLGRVDEAAAVLERFIGTVTEVRGSPSVDECDWLLALGRVRVLQGRREDARRMLEQAATRAEGVAGAESTRRKALDALAALRGE